MKVSTGAAATSQQQQQQQRLGAPPGFGVLPQTSSSGGGNTNTNTNAAQGGNGYDSLSGMFPSAAGASAGVAAPEPVGGLAPGLALLRQLQSGAAKNVGGADVSAAAAGGGGRPPGYGGGVSQPPPGFGLRM